MAGAPGEDVVSEREAAAITDWRDMDAEWRRLRRIEAAARRLHATFDLASSTHTPERRAARLALTVALGPLSSPETTPAGGTTTDCPLEGVHEHAFRGPHRFHEWDPANFVALPQPGEPE